MYRSRRYNRITVYAASAAILIAALLTGCSRTGDEITVISDGTSTVITTETTPSADDGPVLHIPAHMVTKYASLSYDSRMQSVYDSVVDTIMNFEEESHIPLTISAADYVKVLETVRCEQLMFFYLENRSMGDFDISAQSYKMNFIYKYTVDEVNSMLEETEQAAINIIGQTDDTMSDYEKLKFFHDYLVTNVESTVSDEFADTVYGALVKKKALCEGYAKAFSYLCNIAGIENMIVTGYTGVDHMWNMVKLGGSWYHIDIGWDKPSDALQEQFPDLIMYQYFLTSDEVMKNNRVINTYLCIPPAAEADTMNYFVYENKYADSYDKALEIIEDSCRKCIDSEGKYFMLKFDSSNLCLQTVSDLIKADSSGVSDIDRIADKLNFKGQISCIDYYKQYRIIIFVVEQ